MPVISLPDQKWIDLLGPMEGIDFVTWDMVGELPRRDEVSLVVPPYMVARDFSQLGLVPGLRAVQQIGRAHV